MNFCDAICAIVSGEANPPFMTGSGMSAFTTGTWSEISSQLRHE